MNTQFITQQTLEDADINLTGEDVIALLAHLNDVLQERVGTEITDTLSDEQVQAMLKLQESSSEEELAAWIQQNVPDMETIVQEEIDILIGEIVETEEDSQE